MTGWLYVAACVVGPALWGILMYFVFEVIDKRKRRAPGDEPPVDYSI
jgi:hypothetical protein